MKDKDSAEWQRQVRHGALESFSYYRRLLKQGGELSDDARQGLMDMLDFTEDHMVAMWDIVDADTRHEDMTRRASVSLKGYARYYPHE